MTTTVARPGPEEALEELLELASNTDSRSAVERASTYSYAKAFYEMGMIGLDQMMEVQAALGVTPEEIDELPI